MYLLLALVLTIFACGLAIPARNSTIATSTFTTSKVTTHRTTLRVDTTHQTTTLPSTTVPYTEETTTEKAEETDKPYVFQSNFTRKHDAVFVTLRSNGSEVSVSINNTFTVMSNSSVPCEMFLGEHSTGSERTTTSTITIQFTGSLTRELASQFGDRLLDFVELLPTVRSVTNTSASGDAA